MASTDAQLVKINFAPGFHRESTQYSEEGKWFDGNRVRFREGKPENIRGYEKFSTTVLNGTPRDVLLWSDNNSRPYQAIGTNEQLYVVQNETFYDVSPITSIVSVANNFQTYTNSTLVRVSTNNHPAAVNDRVEFIGVSTLGGNLDINDVYTIVSVSGINDFYIDAGTTASSASADQGTAGSINFLMNVENTDDIQGLGYGAGVYNAGVSVSGARAWNDPANQSAITFLANQWSLDTWGEDLLALRRGSKLYYMDTDLSVVPLRSVIVSAAPSANTFLVSPNDRHVVCYGTKEFAASANAPLNNMLVRWSDQEDFTNWTPSITSTSGEVILADGARIIGANRSRNAINIWTDKAMYTQQFVGPPFIFSFTQVGSNCGLIGPHATVNIDGISYWMGNNNFFAYDGRVRTMPCTIRRKLFEDFNMTNKEKVYAALNSEFKEIIWLYPLADSSEPNAYVIYNYEEQTWVYGKLFEDGIITTFNDRTVYDSTITTGKVSASDDFYVYNNEPDGIYTGDGEALTSFIESATFDLQEGKQLMFIDKIIPDYTFDAGEEITFNIKVKDYPTGTETTKGPFTISQNTQRINMRARGREATVRLSATNEGAWRWGAVRMSMQPDGER